MKDVGSIDSMRVMNSVGVVGIARAMRCMASVVNRGVMRMVFVATLHLFRARGTPLVDQ